MNNLKELRKEKEKSIREVAETIGISASALYYYETEQQEPTASVLIKLANYYDTSIDYLLGRKDWY